MLNEVKSEGFAESNHLFYKSLDPSLRSEPSLRTELSELSGASSAEPMTPYIELTLFNMLANSFINKPRVCYISKLTKIIDLQNGMFPTFKGFKSA
ncbi:MAG: hypothetical protein HXX16_12625 [Bacteroidales bacterium]|nr:hypothetical protein [Bacteroidales bacterium]